MECVDDRIGLDMEVTNRNPANQLDLLETLLHRPSLCYSFNHLKTFCGACMFSNLEIKQVAII